MSSDEIMAHIAEVLHDVEQPEPEPDGPFILEEDPDDDES